MDNNTNEMKLADVRIRLADVVHAATVRGEITYLTNRGRRVAAIVPLDIVEAAAQTCPCQKATSRSDQGNSH